MFAPVSRLWLSVVVPAYNEEAGIAGFVTALAARLGELGRPYEIVVVDNGSEDGTREQLAPLVDGHTVRLLCNDVNRGKGYSVRRGMLEARGDLRLLCDADCGPSLPSLPRMIEAMAEVDVAIGSRVAPGASVGKQQPFRRRLVGWPFIAVTRTIMREPAHDVYCGSSSGARARRRPSSRASGSTAGSSTRRRSDWRGDWASRRARSGSNGPTERGRSSRSSGCWSRPYASCWPRAAACAITRRSRRVRPPGRYPSAAPERLGWSLGCPPPRPTTRATR